MICEFGALSICTGVTTSCRWRYNLNRCSYGHIGTTINGSLAAAGSSFLNLLAGDVITLTSGAANTAVTALSVGVAIKAIQDITTVSGA